MCADDTKQSQQFVGVAKTGAGTVDLCCQIIAVLSIVALVIVCPTCNRGRLVVELAKTVARLRLEKRH